MNKYKYNYKYNCKDVTRRCVHCQYSLRAEFNSQLQGSPTVKP